VTGQAGCQGRRLCTAFAWPRGAVTPQSRSNAEGSGIMLAFKEPLEETVLEQVGSRVGHPPSRAGLLHWWEY